MGGHYAVETFVPEGQAFTSALHIKPFAELGPRKSETGFRDVNPRDLIRGSNSPTSQITPRPATQIEHAHNSHPQMGQSSLSASQDGSISTALTGEPATNISFRYQVFAPIAPMMSAMGILRQLTIFPVDKVWVADLRRLGTLAEISFRSCDRLVRLDPATLARLSEIP